MSDAPARPGMLSVIQRGRATVDGWVNILTGLGSALRDKRMAACAQFNVMTETECEELYGADDVASTIVDTLPEEALREWLTFHVEDDNEGGEDGEATVGKAVLDKLTDLAAQAMLRKAWGWSRLYGGAALLMNVDDSKDLAEPLDLAAVRDLTSLTVLSRFELRTTTSLVDLNLQSPRYGQPIWYLFSPRRGGTAGSGQKIHHSRVLRFDGAELPLRLFITNQYWGDSVLNRAQNAIRNYQTSHDSVAAIMQEFNQGVFKIKGLADMLMNGQDDAVQKRLSTVQLSRSICRAVVIDQDEEFSNVGAALSGVGDILDRVGGRLVVASKMPHDKILGDSPSGLGATGESENRVWYDFVASQRELLLRPKVQRLLEVLLAARKGPTAGKVPDDWGFTFKPLWQMDEKEQADIRKTQAETDQIYIGTNVLDPDEVAISRFGGGKYSTETSIDLEARKDDGGAGEEEGGTPPATEPGDKGKPDPTPGLGTGGEQPATTTEGGATSKLKPSTERK